MERASQVDLRREGEITAVVEGRFVATVEGSQLANIEVLRAIVGQIDLNKMADLK